MLESPAALLPMGVSLLPTAPAAMASPSLVVLLTLTDKSRAVVDSGGALLPLTSRSRAVGDAVVALLPSAIWLRTVDDASSLPSPPANLSNSLSNLSSVDSGLLFTGPSLSSLSSSARGEPTLYRGIWGAGSHPTRTRNQAAMPLN